MIAESTKDNFRALYRGATMAVASLALDVFVVPVVAFCRARLGVMQEAATSEVPMEAPSDPAEIRADTTRQPPHYVGMCLVPTAVGGKTICQLRRYDNDEWLWSSRPYKNPAHASRDARRAVQRFGWECLGDVQYADTPQVVDAVDLSAADDRSEEAAAAQRTFASIVDIIVKADKGKVDTWDAVDGIAHVLKRDQGLLGHRLFNSLKANALESLESAFERGQEMSKVPMAAISEWVRQAKDGKEAFGDALGEIASILERELGLDLYALWPQSGLQTSAPTREVLWKQVEGYKMVYASLLEWFKRELALAQTLNRPHGALARAAEYLKIIHQREMGDPHEDLAWGPSVEDKVMGPTQKAIVERAATYENAARKAWADNCNVERKTES